MRITRLVASNVKRLKAVHLELPEEEHLVVVRGNNAQGKTSVIDSIQFALGGKGTHPPRVIRDGAAKAEVVLETEELVVTRRWDHKGTSLEVTNRDGVPQRSPQAVLEKLVGRLSFDPLAFLHLEPKAQLEALKKLVQLDFTELEGQRAKHYAERTAAAKKLSELEGQLAAVQDVEETAPVKTGEVLTRIREAMASVAAVEGAGRERQRKTQALVDAKRDAESAAVMVRRLEEQLAAARGVQAEKERRVAMLEAELEVEPPDGAEERAELARLEAELRDAEATNARARQWEARVDLQKRVESGRSYVEHLTELIRQLDVKKHDAIAAVKMPVEGLGLGDEGVLYRGVPLEQASGAERLRVSVGMGLALNPTLRVLLVRDGSLLDQNSVRLLAQMAAEADAQVWIEMVGEEGAGIIIEDGEVKNASEYAP